jgi:hypothetical protein
MNLETISRKQLNALEQQTRQLLGTLKSAKLQSEPLFESLQQLARELEQVRHERFDETNSEYHTY